MNARPSSPVGNSFSPAGPNRTPDTQYPTPDTQREVTDVRHSTLRRLWAVPLLLMIACGPATTSRGPEAPAVSQAPSGPKRLQLAIISEPTGFHIAVETQRLGITSAGLAYHLFPGLTVWDHEEVLRATTGEAVP